MKPQMSSTRVERAEVLITSPDAMAGVRGEPLRVIGGDGCEIPDHPQDATFFLQAMLNRLGVSYHKYGSIHDSFPHNKNGITNAMQRIDKYLEDGNTEWLVDAANYLLIEFLAPSHKDAHWYATKSTESPGSILNDGGIDHGHHFSAADVQAAQEADKRGELG